MQRIKEWTAPLHVEHMLTMQGPCLCLGVLSFHAAEKYHQVYLIKVMIDKQLDCLNADLRITLLLSTTHTFTLSIEVKRFSYSYIHYRKTLIASLAIETLSWTYEKHKITFNYREKNSTSTKHFPVISPQCFLIMNILNRATHLLFKHRKQQQKLTEEHYSQNIGTNAEARKNELDEQFRIDQGMKKIIKQGSRDSKGFLSGQVKVAMQKNSMLAANRISLAHQTALSQIYGTDAIQMIGKVHVGE